MNVGAQIIGGIAIILWVFSIQNKKKENILFFQFLANMMYAIEYCLLSAISATSISLCSSFRCFLFYSKEQKNKAISKTWLIFFIILVVLLGILTYNGILSLIPIIIALLYTISSWIKSTKLIRIVVIIAAFIWIYYNYKVGAYIGIIGNILEIISGIVSLIKFSKDK